MVMAQHTWCNQCDGDTLHHDGHCTVCVEKERRVRRATWLALTPDEKIEELVKRIERLEQMPFRC